jgi:hypothetical protein
MHAEDGSSDTEPHPLPSPGRHDSAQSPQPRRSLYFLHIPKCGGTAFANAIHRLFPPSAIDPARLWDDVIHRTFANGGLVHGHFGPAPIDEFESRPLTVSVLRDPVTRVVSHYRHIRRDPGHYFHARVNQPRYGFHDFVRDPECRPLVRNHQARHLALNVDRAWVRRHRRDALAPRTPHQAGFELQPLDMSDEEVLATAMRTLESLDLVVTTDHLGGGYRRLAHMLGTATTHGVEPANVAPETGEHIRLRRRDRALLRSLLEVDEELYRVAAQRCAAALSPLT